MQSFLVAYRAVIGFVMKPFRFFRHHLKKSIAALVLLLLGWTVYAVTRPVQPVYVTAPAERGDLRQTVEAVGTITSEKDLELQFPTVDVVSQVMVKEGAKVKAGQTLATLRSGTLSAGVASASANLQSAQAALRALQEGSRPEDIAISEAQVANKRASLDGAKQTLASAEENLLIAKSQLAVIQSEANTGLSGQVTTAASAIAQYLSSAKSAVQATKGVFDANDVQDAIVKNPGSGYDGIQANMNSILLTLTSEQSAAASITDYQSALNRYQSAYAAVVVSADVVSRSYDLLVALPLTTYFTTTSKETNKTTLATQKSNVQTALSSMNAAFTALRDSSAAYDTRIAAQKSTIVSLEGTRDKAKVDISTYETSLKIDEAQLELKKAPARETDIATARARVNQAAADLARASAQFRDTVLTAPVDGIITKVNVKPGEIRPSTEPSITILGDTPFRIEMFVAEVDIPKIQLGQTGSILLDAFRNKPFALRVGEIDSAATDKDGVPKYRIKLDFVYKHDDLKVGMTGDADITTGFKGDVVTVSSRAVIEKEGKQIVRVMKDDGTIEEREVTTGMEGEGGNVEVTNVEEGETVIVLEKK